MDDTLTLLDNQTSYLAGLVVCHIFTSVRYTSKEVWTSG